MRPPKPPPQPRTAAQLQKQEVNLLNKAQEADVEDLLILSDGEDAAPDALKDLPAMADSSKSLVSATRDSSFR